MKVTQLAISEVILIEPTIYFDERGFFYESFNKLQFENVIGSPISFVQDNHSKSIKNVLRGLHYQIQYPQAKLVRVVKGEVFSVAVDIRRGSPTFGHWIGEILSDTNKFQLWIPEQFAHGFVVLSEEAEFVYKANNYYHPEHERCILWNDADLGIQWPIIGEPIQSTKDKRGVPFATAEVLN